MYLLSRYEIEEGLIPAKLYNGIILLSKGLLTNDLLSECCQFNGLATLVNNPCAGKWNFVPFECEEANSQICNYAKKFKVPNNDMSTYCGKSFIEIKEPKNEDTDKTISLIKLWKEKLDLVKFEPTNWKNFEMRNQFPILLKNKEWKIQEMEISGINNLIVNLQAIAVRLFKKIKK